MRLTGILLSATMAASCGAKTGGNKGKAPAVSEQDAIAKGKTLPAVTLIRVPVGTDGKEDSGKAEIRLTDDKSIAADRVVSVFDTSKVPDKTIDELDDTSSTESFCGYYYRRRARYGAVGYYNWMSFMPVYYFGGFNYLWNYANSYPGMGGFNYYQYNQGFNGGYRSARRHGRRCGWIRSARRHGRLWPTRSAGRHGRLRSTRPAGRLRSTRSTRRLQSVTTWIRSATCLWPDRNYYDSANIPTDWFNYDSADIPTDDYKSESADERPNL